MPVRVQYGILKIIYRFFFCAEPKEVNPIKLNLTVFIYDKYELR